MTAQPKTVSGRLADTIPLRRAARPNRPLKMQNGMPMVSER